MSLPLPVPSPPAIKERGCSSCPEAALIRWDSGNNNPVDSYTVEITELDTHGGQCGAAEWERVFHSFTHAPTHALRHDCGGCLKITLIYIYLHARYRAFMTYLASIHSLSLYTTLFVKRKNIIHFSNIISTHLAHYMFTFTLDAGYRNISRHAHIYKKVSLILLA